MEWKLSNPRAGIFEVKIRQSYGKYLLYIKHTMNSSDSPIDYIFQSDSSAKKYYSTNYQSIKHGCQKPKWEQLTDK